MNTRTTPRRALTRLTALLLCVICLLGLLPTSAFALSSGTKASSWFGDAYRASDGDSYYHQGSWHYMVYNKDGTTRYVAGSGTSPYYHYMLTDSSGVTHSVYCIESGVAYTTADNAYTSESGSNSDYLALLPESSQRGLMLTALYGWQPGAELPISGINADDWKMATQCILWEYQQQLRSDPYSLHDNYLVTADQYYKIIAGRPAERAYNWILEQIAKHSEIPSFTGSTESSAPTLELKWDSAAKVYTLTVTDTNGLNEDLELLSGSGVSVTRNGSSYTFTSRNMISDPITFTFRKNIPVADEMLIWGRPGYQTMLTGASDPVTFAVKIKTETYGGAQIIKTSEDGVVSGLPFNISGNGVEMDVTTGADGTISADLLPGVYLVSELPVDRYVTPASQYISVESGATSTVHFSNVLKKFRIHAVKKDAATGTAQGDATLGGAVYGLYLNGELVDTYTTGPDAEFTTRYYACGDGWTLREIQPSTGYLLNDTVYEVGSNPSLYEVELNTTENTVSETVISGSIRIVKHTDEIDPDVQEEPIPQAAETDEAEPVMDDTELSDDLTADSEDISAEVDMPEDETEPEAAEPLLEDEPEVLAANHVGMIERPEEGAQFQIFLSSAGSYDAAKSSERDLLVTDSDGFASSKQLPYGRYTVHQIYGEDGKAFVPDFTVFISENGQVYSYILNNTTITARLRVEKRDSETGELIGLTGTGFRIRNVKTGEYVTQEIYYPNPQTLDVFYVSDEGWLMLPEPLPVGEFELIEVSAPFGYVLSSEPIPFTVDGSEETVTVVQNNAPQKGRITISKQGEVFASVMENAGLYQPVYQVMGLPGAVYDVIADENIYTGDGTLRVAKDTVVETLTTGDDSTATTGPLYLGRYRLEERTAPAGMVLNETPEYVELTYAGETVEVTATSVALYDERQKAAVELKKSLEQDKLFDLGLGEEYKDISFGLYAAYDLEAVDGNVIPAGGLLEVVSVQPDGDHYAASFATNLPMGAFYVKERTTNEAYILSDKEYPVEFGYAGQNTGLVTISVNGGTAIENELLRGRISGVKYGEDPAGGEDIKLAGAVMGLFPGDAEKFTEDTALMTVITGENGVFAFEDVPFGHWIVAEISAPALYTVSPEQHHVYISADGQVIEIRVEDTLIRGSVQLRKTEAINEPSAAKKEDGDSFLRYLPGAVFELYEDTNGDKQFDSGDKKIGTLTETDTGFHTAEGLLAKGYFVKEKIAPENYKLDENAYYFSITEDGQIAVIENGEKGYGFSNEAYRGNLKIVKDSSDGRKDGFAIEVKSADGTYREVFTTPKDGVIEITGLRIGKYTVTELSNRASQGYIIPYPTTVEIKDGQTATVQLFNEKPAKSVPQTGDDYSVYLWAGLMLLSLIGCGGALVLCLRKGGKYLDDPKRDKAVKFTALGLCGVLLIGSGCMLASELRAYRQSSNAYDEIAALVQMPEETTPGTEDGETSLPAEENAAEKPAAVLPTVDFASLREAAPNVIGWLMQEDTAINYPITQTEDNDYYLTHLYDGTYNKAGCLFSDYENRADFSDRSTIVYGHNMRDGSMFASLNQYRKQNYYEAHPTMTLLTPEGSYVVELFAAFNASPKESGKSDSPWRLDFENDADFTVWLSAMTSRSLIQTETAVTARDKVLTLSTCNGSGDRFIVMGKLTAVN